MLLILYKMFTNNEHGVHENLWNKKNFLVLRIVQLNDLTIERYLNREKFSFSAASARQKLDRIEWMSDWAWKKNTKLYTSHTTILKRTNWKQTCLKMMHIFHSRTMEWGNRSNNSNNVDATVATETVVIHSNNQMRSSFSSFSKRTSGAEYMNQNERRKSTSWWLNNSRSFASLASHFAKLFHFGFSRLLKRFFSRLCFISDVCVSWCRWTANAHFRVVFT